MPESQEKCTVVWGDPRESCCLSDFLKNMWEVARIGAWGTDQSKSWQETDNLSHLRESLIRDYLQR